MFGKFRTGVQPNTQELLAEGNSGNRAFFPTIDVLRAVAALSVVMFHVIGYNQWTGFYDYPKYFLRQGWLGVDLFFVISGFVVSTSLFAMYDRGGGYFTQFLMKRAVRICPLYYLTCVVFVVLISPGLLSQDGFAKQAVLYSTFLFYFNPNQAGAINPPSWSLAVEVHFYLLIAIIIPVLRNANPWLVAASGILAALVWRSACYWLLKDESGKVHAAFFFTTQLPGMIDCFAMGFAVARIMADREFERFRDWCSRHLWLLGTLVVLAYGIAHYIYSRVPITYDDWRLDARWYLLIAHHVLTTLAFGLLVLCSCFMTHPAWLKLTAPVRYLGVISYGVYLWHVIVILALKKAPHLSGSARLALTLGLTVVLASASWHLLERPLSRRAGANKLHTEKLSSQEALRATMT